MRYRLIRKIKCFYNITLLLPPPEAGEAIERSILNAE
jgi:hypothetical protein